MLSAGRSIKAATVVSLFSLLVCFGWITLTSAQSAPQDAKPQRILGSSNTLANHDVKHPGGEVDSDATLLRYTITVKGKLPSKVSMPSFYMSPTHMSNPTATPARVNSDTVRTAELTWQPDTPIAPGEWTHVGYSVETDVTECLKTVLGGEVTFIDDSGGETPIDPTVVVDWCGEDVINDELLGTGPLALSRMLDSAGEPMTATLLNPRSNSILVTVRLGTNSSVASEAELLPLLGDREAGQPDFDTTFTPFTDTIGPLSIRENSSIALPFPGSVTTNTRWLGVAVEVFDTGPTRALRSRSFFARSVEKHEPVASPTPRPTNTPDTPTIEPPTPTDTPTPTETPDPATVTPSPTGPPVTPQPCPNIESRVPAAELQAALANPQNVNGYGHRCFPSQPVSPFNPLRETLGLQNPNRPYHPIFNPLIFTCGC